MYFYALVNTLVIFSPICMTAFQNTWVVLKCLCSKKIGMALCLEKRIKREHWSVYEGKNDPTQYILPKYFSNPGNSFLFKNGNEKCREMILLPLIFCCLLMSVRLTSLGCDPISQPKAGSNLVQTDPSLLCILLSGF